MEYSITPAELERGHSTFEEHEYRDVFYRAATELISIAIGAEESTFPVEDALAVVLETWNRALFRFHKIDRKLFFEGIKTFLLKCRSDIIRYRNRSIESLDENDHDGIVKIFTDFETVHGVGAVGAAKALHLLAPTFFPLWDRQIAARYGQVLLAIGLNGSRYWRFMLIAQRQHRELSSRGYRDRRDLLKWIDEYNYCKYTRKWL